MYVHKPIIDAFDLVNFHYFPPPLTQGIYRAFYFLPYVPNSPFYFVSLYIIVVHTEGLLGTRRVKLECREFLHLFFMFVFWCCRGQSNFLFNDFFLHRYSLLQINASLPAGFKPEITVRIGWDLNVLLNIHNIWTTQHWWLYNWCHSFNYTLTNLIWQLVWLLWSWEWYKNLAYIIVWFPT